MKNITINLATLQNDTKLATVIKATNNLDIDTLTIWSVLKITQLRNDKDYF